MKILVAPRKPFKENVECVDNNECALVLILLILGGKADFTSSKV